MAEGGTKSRRGLFERLAVAKIVFLVMAVALVMAACGGDDKPTDTTSSSGGGGSEGGTVQIDGQSANNHGEADVTGKTETDVEADDFYFEPTVLTGEAGQTITIHVENEGDATHNFSITDQDISEDIDPGDDADIKVTFPDSGTVAWFCKFHQGQGMVGGLQVSS